MSIFVALRKQQASGFVHAKPFKGFLSGPIETLTLVSHCRLYQTRGALKLAAMGVHTTSKVILRAL